MSVGQPAHLKLEEFGSLLQDVFEEVPYQVGSSLAGKAWRDVDVRLLFDDNRWAAEGFGDPARPQQSARWWGLVRAFAALGREMTGLPIDFQIQQRSWANEHYPSPDHRRSALGFVPWRIRKLEGGQ